MNRAGMRRARGLAVGVLAVCAGLAGAVIPSAVGGAQVEPSQIQATANAIPGEYIVALRPTAKGDVPGFANSLAARYGGEVFFTYESAFTGFAIRTTPDRAEQLARNPHVESVAENGVAQADTTEPAPPAPWGLDRIDEEYLPLDGSYKYVANGAGVTAYIIDTGIRVGAHASSAAARSSVSTTIGDGRNGTDCNGHGTHVVGHGRAAPPTAWRRA